MAAIADPESNTNFNAESICHTATASSSPGADKQTKLFATFPPFIKTQELYDHFSNNGFDEHDIDIHRHINKATGKPSASATVYSMSQEEDIIARLNGTMILGKYKLKIEPYRQPGQHYIKKQSSAQLATQSVVPNTLGKGSMQPTDSCPVFVGVGLPEYIKEHHIHEHFHKFSQAISKVETIRDKQTNIPKGNFIVVFQSEAHASMAIQELNKSRLLGQHKLKVERYKFQPSAVSPPSTPTLFGVVLDNLNPTVSIDEVKALVSVPVVKHSSVEANSHQLYLQFHNQQNASVAIQNLDGKHLLGEVLHAYSDNIPQGNFHPAPCLQQPDCNDDRQHHSYMLKSPTPSQSDFPPNSQSDLHKAESLCYPVKITMLASTVTEEELYDLFKHAGEVIGKPVIHISEKRYAHVNFKQKSGAQNAVKQLNGTVVHGNKLRVSVQKPKPLDKYTMNTTSLNSSTNLHMQEIKKESMKAKFHVKCVMSKDDFMKFMQHQLSSISCEFEIAEIQHNHGEQSSNVIVQFPSIDIATSAIEQLQNNSDVTGEICEPKNWSGENLFIEKIEEFKQSIQSKSEFFLTKHKNKTEGLIEEREKQNLPKNCPVNVFQDITAKRKVLDQAIIECNQQHTEFTTYCVHLYTRLTELEAEAKVLITASEQMHIQALEQSLHNKLSNMRRRFGNECNRLERALPMYAYRTHILEVIQKQSCQVIILIGETGSGKSTQLVQYVYEHGVASSGIIACTQPRKVAAISLARHISTEMGIVLGQTVGYKTGLHGEYAEKTKVIYMTDHTLLNECIVDPTFSKYSCLIIDEAHERSLSTDLLLALIKKCLPNRPDLKVIITSATIDPKIFDEYFGGSCPIIEVPGRMYPVEIIWNPLRSDKSPLDRDYVSDCVNLACQLHASEPPGDILVFLTSAAEIEKACQSTTNKLGKNAIVLPLHGKLPPEEQRKIFQEDDQRKIVFATNVAETSVTIPGVKYIIDTGLAKELCFDPRRNMNSLEVRIISKSSAEQRKGRAGRTSAGMCYRLYSEALYNEMPSKSLPEILRVTLETTVLKLHEFGVADVLSFSFIEEPDRIALVKAVENLQFLEAIRDGHLTDLGKKMAALPIDPHLSRIMLDGISKGIGLEAAVSAAISTLAGSVFFRGGTDEMKQESDMKTITFCHQAGDQMTYLQTYFQWAAQEHANQNKWCVEHYVNAKSMRMISEIVKEFRDILRIQFDIILEDRPFNPDLAEKILPKLYCDTFIKNVCIFLGHERVGYLNVNLPNERLFIFNGSPLRQLNIIPKLLIYEKTLVTSRHFLLQALPVRDKWIYEAVKAGKLPCHPNESALYNELCVVPVVASNLGEYSLKRLQKSWKNNKTVMDGTKPVLPQVDYDYKQGAMKVFVLMCHQDKISQLLSAEVSELRNELKGEVCEKGVTKDDDSVRVILACGVSVKRVLMADQYRTVTVKGTSASTINREEILQALKHFGEIESDRRNFKNDHQLFVTFVNPDDACEAVRSFQYQLKLPDTTVQPYTPYQQESICTFTLHVEWCRRAKEYAFVNFKNEEDFSIAVQRFCIPGNTAYFGLRSMKCKPSKDGKAQLFITNVDQQVTEDQIKDNVHTRLPEVSEDKFEVRLGYEKSFETTPQQLRELEQQLDSLVTPHVTMNKYEIFLSPPNDFSKKYQAQIKFENADERDSALRHIQSNCAHINGHILTVKAVLSSSVRYSPEVYSVVEKSIQEVTEQIHSKYNNVKVYHGKKDKKGRIIVRITSEDMNTFEIVKQTVNSVFSPYVVDCSTPELRRFILMVNCKRALEKIEKETSTFIRLDINKATISIYGCESNIITAQREFKKCLSFLDSGSKGFELHLKEAGRPPGLMKHLVSLFGPGLRHLQEREGVTIVRLDPRRQLVTVFATQEVYEFLNGKIDEYTKAFDANSLSTIHYHNADEVECCTCFTVIASSSDIFRLEYCGHTYCIDCIQLQLSPFTVEFPILCAADGCSEALVWKDIYNLSNQTSFSIRNLITASIKSYIAANQDKVRYCPTPDCSMIYSVTKEGHCFSCQECGAMVCTACHEQHHEGTSCAKILQEKQADKEFEAWLQGDPSNRKRCPKCSTAIEKTYGCNRVTCIRCKANICWFCLKYFSTCTECYDHMSAEHGSWGL